MDFNEQNKLVEQLHYFLRNQLGDKPHYCILAVEGEPGVGFAFSRGNLSEEDSFRSFKVITGGIGEEAKAFLDKFKLPSDEKPKKPVEPK